MDQELSEYSRNPVVITGIGHEIAPVVRRGPAATTSPHGDAALSHDADPTPFLRVKKTIKFMSKQDRLALVAAARAVHNAGLGSDTLETRTTIAMAIGPIPFQEDEAMLVAEYSGHEGHFSMKRFCSEAYDKVNPMLLFACLPNMPAYHISANLIIRGGYNLTYPSCAESYMALRGAVSSLSDGRTDAVLYGAVADQQNFLVQNHHRKTDQSLPAPDGACFLVLETLRHAQARNASVFAILRYIRITVEPATSPARGIYHFGPVDLPLAVALFTETDTLSCTHQLQAGGHLFESTWTRNPR